MRALLKIMFFALLITLIAGWQSTAFCESKNEGNSVRNDSASGSYENQNDGNSVRNDNSEKKTEGNSLRNSNASSPQFLYGGSFRVRVQASHGINQ